MSTLLVTTLLLAAPARAQDAPLVRAGTLYGAWPGADYGAALHTAGDVDGDGLPDLAVGAPFEDAGGDNRGLVVVYHALPGGGGYAGESWSHTGSVDLGHWGGALAGGGDLDGDGFDDLAVAATFQDRRVDVFRGGKAGLSAEPDWTFTQGGGSYGWAVAMLADGTGDGRAELAIGDASAGDWGEIELHPGAAEGFGAAPQVLLGDSDHPVGAVLASAADVDGDGLDDLLAAPGSDWTTGAAAIYAGGSEGLDSTPTYHLSRPSTAAGFGVDAAGAGDVDGDGYGDVVVGADGLGEGSEVAAGQVLVWAGAATGPGGLATWTWSDDDPGSMLGRSVDGVGDVDGDGYGELLVGRPGWEDGEELEGGVLLLVGSADGPVAEPAWTEGSDVSASDRGGVWIGLGTAVAGVGDATGDGHADVVVGVINVGGASYEERLGEVWLYTGTTWTPPDPDEGGDDTGGEAQDTGADDGSGSCGCSGGAATGGLWLVLAGLLGLGRRRR